MFENMALAYTRGRLTSETGFVPTSGTHKCLGQALVT